MILTRRHTVAVNQRGGVCDTCLQRRDACLVGLPCLAAKIVFGHAVSSSGKTSCIKRRAVTSHQYSETSIPIACLPKSFAARIVVPLPINGSRIIPSVKDKTLGTVPIRNHLTGGFD